MLQNIVILVVEDEALLRIDIVDELRDRGFEVLEASNASDAILTLLDNPGIQVLFTDVDMPGTMDGLMLAAAVRDRWPPIQIIVASGHRNVALSDLPESSRFFGKPNSVDAVASAAREMAI